MIPSVGCTWRPGDHGSAADLPADVRVLRAVRNRVSYRVVTQRCHPRRRLLFYALMCSSLPFSLWKVLETRGVGDMISEALLMSAFPTLHVGLLPTDEMLLIPGIMPDYQT